MERGEEKIYEMIDFELIISLRAQIDIDETFVWYEEQQSGLGESFIEAFEDVLNKINSNPYFASFIEKDARSAALKKFPYETIYCIDENKQQVRIIAVIHQHRSKGFLKRRLNE